MQTPTLPLCVITLAINLFAQGTYAQDNAPTLPPASPSQPAPPSDAPAPHLPVNPTEEVAVPNAPQIAPQDTRQDA
ncbi:MAG: hypothetical protein V3V20_12805, partial [Algisphaera sp.]